MIDYCYALSTGLPYSREEIKALHGLIVEGFPDHAFSLSFEQYGVDTLRFSFAERLSLAEETLLTKLVGSYDSQYDGADVASIKRALEGEARAKKLVKLLARHDIDACRSSLYGADTAVMIHAESLDDLDRLLRKAMR